VSTKTARAATAEANVVCPDHLKGITLPLDWEWVSLGNICRTTSGGTPSRKNKEYFEGDIPWVKSGELPDGPVSEIEEYITGEAVKNSSAKQFPKGTLLIALYGATVGKLGVLTQEAATNQAVCAIFPPDDLETKYLFWYLRFVRSDLIAQAIGGAQPNISQGILRNLLIPVAPFYQQKQIVAEIEKQYSRLDEAVANLNRVKANLKRYRAAVLKAAVKGKLTEGWRKQHPDVEPASKLVDRILVKRRAKWGGRGKYKEPLAQNTNELPSLPNGWTWATVEQITSLDVGFAFKSSEFVNSGMRLLRGENIEPGSLRWEDTRYWPEARLQGYQHLLIRKGDIVLAMDRPLISSGLKIARARAADLPCLLVQRMARFLPADEGMASFIFVCLNSDAFVRHLLRGQTGTQLPHISGSGIQSFLMPIPPLKEQEQIVAEVERRLSVIEELEAATEANLTRADRLRQSILSQAFSGRLLGQEAKYISELMPVLSIAAETQARYGKGNRAGR
jgi:type I restriction enzyme S subunit